MSKSKDESWFSVCFSIVNFILGCDFFGKTIVKKTGSAHKYFNFYPITYCLTLFHLFYCCFCFHNQVGLILFKITSLDC